MCYWFIYFLLYTLLISIPSIHDAPLRGMGKYMKKVRIIIGIVAGNAALGTFREWIIPR